MDKSSRKLTKKQKKALEFRARKGKHVEDQRDVPEVDIVEDDDSDQIPPPLEAPSTSTSKRKRDEGEGEASESPTNKRRKGVPVGSNTATEPDSRTKEKKHRYILFVGRHPLACTILPFLAHVTDFRQPFL